MTGGAAGPGDAAGVRDPAGVHDPRGSSEPAGVRDLGASIRPATLEDVAAIRAILAAHGNDGPPGALLGPDIVGPYVRHLLARHRVLVAADAAGAVVAFGAVVDTGLSHHLADLFVRPDLLGHGLGRPLLREVFGDRWPRTTFASDDPRALPLYVRAGMAARWPVLYLQGGRVQAELASADPRARRVEVVPADPAELVELERTWTGADRSVDHALEASLAGADPFLVRDAEGPLAAGYGRDRQTAPDARAVDRLVLRPGAEPVGTVLAAVARAAAAGATIDVAVPGPHPALPVLLELGFRVGDRDTYMAGPVGPDRPVAPPPERRAAVADARGSVPTDARLVPCTPRSCQWCSQRTLCDRAIAVVATCAPAERVVAASCGIGHSRDLPPPVDRIGVSRSAFDGRSTRSAAQGSGGGLIDGSPQLATNSSSAPPNASSRARIIGQPPPATRSRRANSSRTARHAAASRSAWRTIHGSTRLESSSVTVAPPGPSSSTIPEELR